MESFWKALWWMGAERGGGRGWDACWEVTEAPQPRVWGSKITVFLAARIIMNNWFNKCHGGALTRLTYRLDDIKNNIFWCVLLRIWHVPPALSSGSITFIPHPQWGWIGICTLRRCPAVCSAYKSLRNTSLCCFLFSLEGTGYVERKCGLS